ncbi:MAG TPA: glycosyltransferase, partial [Propionicimonas sp.]
MPLVSVVVPVRNGERHLRESLGSICRQSLTDLEIIVVDDGSTDRTPQILAELAAQDSRIRIIPGPATGSAGAARNSGLEVARGEYLAFLDADDFFAPRLLEKLYRKASTDKADVAVTRFRVFDERTGERVSVNWGLRTKYLPARTPFPPEQLGAALFYSVSPVVWNKMFRTAFVHGLGLQFQPLRRTNDVFFTFSAIAQAARITYVDESLIDYRIGNTGSLQGSLHETPLEFAESLTALQAGLKASGRFPALEQAFVNEAVEICLTNLGKASTYPAFQQVHAALRSELLARFGALHRQPDYFVNPELAARLAQLLDTTAEEYLFGQLTAAGARAVKAQADALTARHEAEMREVASRSASRLPGPDRPATPPSTGAPTGDRPDVSVIIPVYNAAPFLSDCIASIQRQTGVTVEIICIDDGSTDSSP